MDVSLLYLSGSDLAVVNAARVSYGKRKKAISHTIMVINDGETRHEVAQVDEADQKLIRYLARENHWTPFGHTSLTFHLKAPMFVARQLGKHQVGMVWNEISRRYVDEKPEFYNPGELRLRAPSVKQGSLDETISVDLNEYYEQAEKKYQELLEQGIAPEEARMVLPMGLMTEWYWTGSLYAFVRVCKLRLDPHAQAETREIAGMIAYYCSQAFPVSWAAFFPHQ